MQDIEFSFDLEAPAVRVHTREGSRDLPALWLRERCQDSVHLDPATQQRLFDPHQLDDDLALVSIEQVDQRHVDLAFSDGYAGRYDITEFRADFDPLDGAPTPVAWKSADDKSRFLVPFDSLGNEQGVYEALEKFLTYGVIIVDGVPKEKEAVLRVAGKFGFVRETNFGKYFEVYNRPDSNDLAYRAIPLGPHTDNPYRDPMPGIQLLHCLENETSGGLSTLVDSLAVLEAFKAECPDAYELLSKVPVRYRHVEEGTDLIERRTMIQTDLYGNIKGVAYSPRLDYLPLLGQEDTRIFHRARRRLGQLFSSAEFQWKFRLEPGQLQMFHNTRVLHGRTSFDPTEGFRHLQGAYLDLDAPKGFYKALKRKFNA